MRIRQLILILLVFAAGVTTAQADVIYSFTGLNSNFGGADGLPIAFTFTTPDFIYPLNLTPTADPYPCVQCVVLTVSQLDSCLNCLPGATDPALFIVQPNVALGGLMIVFTDVNGQGPSFVFDNNALSVPGTYASFNPFNTTPSGTLTVTAVPEPSSAVFATCCTLILVAVCFFRHRQLLRNSRPVII